MNIKEQILEAIKPFKKPNCKDTYYYYKDEEEKEYIGDTIEEIFKKNNVDYKCDEYADYRDRVVYSFINEHNKLDSIEFDAEIRP